MRVGRGCFANAAASLRNFWWRRSNRAFSALVAVSLEKLVVVVVVEELAGRSVRVLVDDDVDPIVVDLVRDSMSSLLFSFSIAALSRACCTS